MRLKPPYDRYGMRRFWYTQGTRWVRDSRGVFAITPTAYELILWRELTKDEEPCPYCGAAGGWLWPPIPYSSNGIRVCRCCGEMITFPEFATASVRANVVRGGGGGFTVGWEWEETCARRT